MKFSVNKFYKQNKLNKTKEITLIILVNIIICVLFISLFILFKNFNYIILLFIVILIVNFIFIIRYYFLNKKNRIKSLIEIQKILSFLYLFLNNKIEIKDALEKCKNYSSITSNENIVLLLDEIKKDKTNIPYINFAKKYGENNLEEVMINIFNLTNNKTESSLQDFNQSYLNLNNKIGLELEKEKKKDFEFISFSPLIGTAIIVLFVIISTLLLARGYLNG